MNSKILIVDDLKDTRLKIKLSLKQAGDYTFIEAENGKEGVELAIKEHPHIILMDAIMPVMDGFEAIRLIRNSPKTKDIPILMVSALDNKDEKVKALQSGISDFIAKPFDKTELIIRVNSLLTLYLQFLEKNTELQQINANLEEKVNEKLNKRVEEIKLASIGQMATGITHELNTPVTYMKATLEILELYINDIEATEIKIESLKLIHTLNKGLQRLRNIIDTTKEVAKKGKNKKEPENIYATLIYATRMVYNRAKHLSRMYINNTPFSLDINENFENFEANIIKEKLEQVWIIILNNSCDEFERSSKEFEERRIGITIEKNKQNDTIVIKFKDNAGKGISQDLIPKIFEPFISTKIDSGIGVGLNIAKEIIEIHNGTIKAYNEDECAVFEIELPVK